MKMFDFKSISDKISIKCLYQKGMMIHHEHDRCERIGIIISGQIKMTHYTYQGQERVLAILNQGDLFGDFLIHSSSSYFPGDLIAMENTEISFMNQNQLMDLLSNHMPFRRFYLQQLSEKALKFNRHNKILMQQSIREKINMWMSYQIPDHKNRIKISSKEALANLFNVARPSLSRELSKMKEDRLIDYDRNYITILQ